MFHFDRETSGSVAEVAHLCSRGIEVNVWVSNSNSEVVKQAYGAIPGVVDSLTVQPLVIPSSELNIERIHRLMAVWEKNRSSAAPTLPHRYVETPARFTYSSPTILVGTADTHTAVGGSRPACGSVLARAQQSHVAPLMKPCCVVPPQRGITSPVITHPTPQTNWCP